MFGSTMLEVAIGMAFLFTLLSLAATSLREMIEALLKTRAIHLERGLRELLDDRDRTNNIVAQLYGHPLVAGLFAGDYSTALKGGRGKDANGNAAVAKVPYRSNLPAYIPSRNLALALLDLTARGDAAAPNDGASPGQEPLSLERVRAAVTGFGTPKLQRAILVALDEAQGDLQRVQLSLEAWFDSGMDRVSGWYKRRTQWILFAIGLATAIWMNVDSIYIARTLVHQDALRQTIVAQAEVTSAQLRTPSVDAAGLQRLSIEDQRLKSELGSFSKLIGWDGAWSRYDRNVATEERARRAAPNVSERQVPLTFKADAWWTHFVKPSPSSVPGWLLTALAISLGAPFWFDVLNKVMVIRSTVKPYEKSAPEGSEDREGGKPAAARLAGGSPGGGGPGGPGAGAAPGGPVNPSSDGQGLHFVPRAWAQGDPQEGVI